METVLILIGVACVIGAIIGGGIKMQVIEMRSFESLWRQFVLAAFGAGLIMFGLNARDREPENNIGSASVGQSEAQPATPDASHPAPEPAKPEPKPEQTNDVVRRGLDQYVKPTN